MCWPVPETTDNGVVILDSSWDSRASILADHADCVARALMRLSCDPDRQDPFVEAIISQTGSMVRYIETTPLVPQGGCAGVQWKLYASPRSGRSAS